MKSDQSSTTRITSLLNRERLLTVEVDGLTYGGAFIGRIVDGEAGQIGKKTFVRDTVPGEKILATVVEEKKSYSESELTEILVESPSRIVAPCAYYLKCGGCDIQHIELSVQREVKRKMVEDTLKFQGKIVPKNGVKLVGEKLAGFGYRKRVTLHLNEDGNLGFYRQKSGDVVQIGKCLLGSDVVNDGIQKVIPHARSLAKLVGGVLLEDHSKELFIVLKIREDSTHTDLPVAQKEDIAATIKNFDVVYRKNVVSSYRNGRIVGKENIGSSSLGHFSQVNEEGNSILIDIVKEKVTSKKVTDLYAGSGNFSIPLASIGCQVDAVELDPVLAFHGEGLAASAKLSESVRFFSTSAEKFVKSNMLQPTVVLDPPRAGAKEVVKAFKQKKVKQVVYVSCNLPSLCRDLKTLSDSGYEILETSVVDMFSQTHHVETVTVCELKS